MDGLLLYAPLMSAVCGLIMIGIVEIILALMGFNKLVCLISFGSSVVSITVYSGLIYVDTLKAIEQYNNDQLNSIKCAVDIVLDLANLLVNIMRIFVELSKKK
jgi:FtsH-binding integral membrane protein